MSEQLMKQTNVENAEVICERILKQAEEEVVKIKEAALRQKEKILQQAQQEAQKRKQQLLDDSQKQTEKIKEKILSSLVLEKKRLILQNKDRLIKEVFAQIQKQAEDFRLDSKYPYFLEKAIIEAVMVVGSNELVVIYSKYDRNIFNENFRKKIEASCCSTAKKSLVFHWKESDFQDIGVIVYSADGRLMFDNRFSSRLERQRQNIEQELLRYTTS
ncbi:MAG: V-type ATP synthase subunit E [Candidatus Omnitrophica bacterium]|nr:V-type ATP synthase subunit E [Candidatus Omnitrophota bacterium]